MLVACDSGGNRRLAWDVEKGDGPFSCPVCSASAILKKGKIRTHHFSHKPPHSCQYGEGESYVHHETKKELFELLSQYKNCFKCELERVLDGVRPDVSLYIGKVPVAIEIQRSTISIEDIISKANRYSALGIYFIYILPASGPQLIWRPTEQEHVCRPRQWERYLHSMFFGRVYYKRKGLQVRPYHFGDFNILVEDKEWYDSYGYEQYSSGYNKKSKQMKLPQAHPRGDLHLATDFEPRERDFYLMKGQHIPSCKLWIDKLSSWW